MSGKVWMVGAGPGDGGLLTVKGSEILKHAEVVIYDALISEEVKAYIPEHAETVYVGKRSSNHTMAQEKINQTIVEYALQGKKVVRLKGGDPFLFGRGGEEVEALLEAGISYEIVPGVTSAFAVPAYNGIPVTHRDYCSSVHVITGHKRGGKELDLDFEALVRVGGTMVFLMGISSLGAICDGLCKGGMPPETPAAVLSKGTTKEQKRIVATVGSLEEKMKENPLDTPAIIVVGDVCSLSEKFSWFEMV